MTYVGPRDASNRQNETSSIEEEQTSISETPSAAESLKVCRELMSIVSTDGDEFRVKYWKPPLDSSDLGKAIGLNVG